MGLFGNRETKKRMSMFRTLVRDILISMETMQWPSCETVVMQEIDAIIKVSKKDFAAFPPGYNYEELALNVIGDVTFCNVTSGQYHFYTGSLKPIGMQMKEVCIRCANKANERGYLGDDDYQEFLKALTNGIASVG